MEESILVDSEQCGRGGNKTQQGKVVKGDFVGGPTKKMLTDITNLQQEHLKLSNQPAKKQSATLGVDESTDQLLKENAMLMKLLASRNSIIESSKAELQKLQGNSQKLRVQNVDLARANNQMLAELNSSRQRLRELQLELGCKNGILKAMKLEPKEKEQTSKLKDEITANESQQSGQNFKADRREDNLSNAKRRKVSKSQSSGAAVIKQANPKEKVDNQRHCLRRQSMGLKSEKPGLTEDSLEIDNSESCVSHLHEDLVKREGLTSSGTTVKEENRVDTEYAGPSSIVQIPVENIGNRRQSLRRQSARFRTDVSEPTEETREDTEFSGLPTVQQVDRKENVDKRITRQSARFKPEDPKPTEDVFEIDDPKFAVLLHDNVIKRSSPTTTYVDSRQQNNENNSTEFDPLEVRRSSVGRPLRRAVEKVQSYKEIPRNVKLRRAG